MPSPVDNRLLARERTSEPEDDQDGDDQDEQLGKTDAAECAVGRHGRSLIFPATKSEHVFVKPAVPLSTPKPMLSVTSDPIRFIDQAAMDGVRCRLAAAAFVWPT